MIIEQLDIYKQQMANPKFFVDYPKTWQKLFVDTYVVESCGKRWASDTSPLLHSTQAGYLQLPTNKKGTFYIFY